MSTRGRLAAAHLVRRAVAPERVEDSCQLACESDGRDATAAALLYFQRPALQWSSCSSTAAESQCPSCLDQDPAHGGRSRFGDAKTLLPLRAGALPRRKPEIGLHSVCRGE